MAKITRPAPKRAIPLEAKLVFKGIIYEVYHWEQELFDGTKTTFEMLKRPDTVEIIPITNEGKILINYEEQSGLAPFICVPGGRVDYGEDPEAAAKRELLEETGYETHDLVLWNAAQPMEKIDWAIYIFIGKNCTKVNDPTLEAGEKIGTKEVSFEEFVEIVQDDNFRDEEISLRILKAKDKGKLDEIKRLFFG
ncbi:hypothetical protein A2803_02665 [Candidatus Woesebacteria bacterium RIFCSPHIGHO2_01_FULL_44_21]|uniref:Nudix hydrolase domain-containing protein n=1 Tax=Candidatus Woesebacteria bacterium RIFCSPHIGHO2_01_FULL_44_21 TaxID=1802503 RepID=A0A1F7YXG4_9BACT|nr:MAG: hypothetical protein A2803_02665 [Candidatus Woesebacteria bacterium RIFCSPHIGHO2_01_FULL_44_21]OGM69825.1 MAG: hypothetical protein A2897_00580 [Candidatus Woesebacteria bacterium RIFCSPLOWO2_01_FULL_44_24b]